MLRLIVALVLAGILAQPAQALEFADFTTAGEDAISGTLLGSSISVTGSEMDAQTTDGSGPWFAGPYFTPPLATSDAFEIYSHDTWSYRIAFGAPVKNPTLQIFSLGSRLVFPAGTQLQVVSGHTLLHVEGNALVGATYPNGSGSLEDTSGTVRVLGTVDSVTFDTQYPGTDGVVMTVGGSPPDPMPPDGGGGGGGGGGISDRDGDHVTDDADCRPDDPAIHPGAKDIPGDGIDQDCDQLDTPMRIAKRSLERRYVVIGNTLRFRRLALVKPRAGDTVRVTCVRCAAASVKRTIAKNRGALSLLRYFRGVRLHRGAVVRIRIDHPQQISYIASYRVNKRFDIVRRARCQAPGAPEATSCRR